MGPIRIRSVLLAAVTILPGLPQAAGGQSIIPHWRLSASPTVSIGGEGRAETEFLRVEGAFRLSNGHIAVVNDGTSEIRFFTERGELRQAFGRRGGGPGEFERITWAGRVGDTLLVYDSSLRRVTSVLPGANPKLLATIRVTARGNREMFFVTGRLADGRWLVTTFISPRLEGPTRVYRAQGSVGLIRASADGMVDWLVEVTSALLLVYSPTGNLKDAVVGPIAFSPYHHAVATRDCVWLGGADTDSLTTVCGARRRVVRLPIPPRTPSSELIAAGRAELAPLTRDEVDRRFLKAKLSAEYLPKRLPFYEDLVAGLDGEVWIQEFAGIRSAPTRYLVMGPDLRARAWVDTPAGFRVTDVGPTWVVGVHQDADGVETVRAYVLRRN